MTDTETETVTGELILRHLKGLRKENEFFREAILTFGRQLERFGRDIGEIKRDILLLENNNLGRHTEILSILHRLDETDIQ